MVISAERTSVVLFSSHRTVRVAAEREAFPEAVSTLAQACELRTYQSVSEMMEKDFCSPRAATSAEVGYKECNRCNSSG